MGHAVLSKEQIKELLNSWKNAPAGSKEQKLIEGLFLITETPMPLSGGGRRDQAA